MSLQHAQAYVESLRELVERVEYRRAGDSRGDPRTRAISTPESSYAAGWLRYLGDRCGGEPTASPLIPPHRRVSIEERVRKELAK